MEILTDTEAEYVINNISESASIPSDPMCVVSDYLTTSYDTQCQNIMDCCAKLMDHNKKIEQYNKEQHATYSTTYTTWINRRLYFNNVTMKNWKIGRDSFIANMRSDRVLGKCSPKPSCINNSVCPDEWEKDKETPYTDCEFCMGDTCQRGCQAKCRRKEDQINRELQLWDSKNPRPEFNEPEPKREDYPYLSQKTIKWSISKLN